MSEKKLVGLSDHVKKIFVGLCDHVKKEYCRSE